MPNRSDVTLRQIMRLSGITPSRLGIYTGMSTSSISQYALGYVVPTSVPLAKITGAMSILSAEWGSAGDIWGALEASRIRWLEDQISLARALYGSTALRLRIQDAAARWAECCRPPTDDEIALAYADSIDWQDPDPERRAWKRAYAQGERTIEDVPPDWLDAFRAAHIARLRSATLETGVRDRARTHGAMEIPGSLAANAAEADEDAEDEAEDAEAEDAEDEAEDAT